MCISLQYYVPNNINATFQIYRRISFIDQGFQSKYLIYIFVLSEKQRGFCTKSFLFKYQLTIFLCSKPIVKLSTITYYKEV